MNDRELPLSYLYLLETLLGLQLVTGPFTLLSEPWTSEENTTLLRAEKVTTLHALLGTVTPGITTHRVSGSICLAKQIVKRV
jgi:hypothetical protein